MLTHRHNPRQLQLEKMTELVEVAIHVQVVMDHFLKFHLLSEVISICDTGSRSGWQHGFFNNDTL